MNKSKGKNETNKKIMDKFNDSFLEENKVIFKKYKPLKIIGKGAFGKIYSTIRLKDKSIFAMKTERKNYLKKILETEAYFLFLLQGFGIPKLITFGHSKNYSILIETLLDKSLHDIFIKTRKPCDLKNLCLIAIQLIERLEFIHSKNIIYCDVKPENFMIGIKDPNVIYIVDFGLCKKYRSSKTGKHILPRTTKKLYGTLKYCSVNVLKGKEQSRRDDLISLAYVLIFLNKRNLPWTSDYESLNERTYFELVMTKLSNAGGDLFKNIPEELADYVKYCEKLKFEEDPNYNYMKGFFLKILNRSNLNINKINFSWIDPNDKSIKTLPRVRSSSRNRILKNLENRRLIRNKINSLEQINKYKNNSAKNKDIIKNKSTLNHFGNLSNNFNNNITNISIENHSNVNYNLTQTEKTNLINYINSYTNDKKMVKSKIKIRNIINPNIKIKKKMFKINNSDVNDNIFRMKKNMNSQKNIYVNYNFFNLGNERNNSITNNIINNEHNFKFNKMILNIYKRNIIYKPKMAFINVNNNRKYSSNSITDRKNIENNNIPCRNLEYKYASVLSNKQINNNLYNLYINNSKLYKMKRKDCDNNKNDIINNRKYYSITTINKSNSKSKKKILTIHIPNIYNKSNNFI